MARELRLRGHIGPVRMNPVRSAFVCKKRGKAFSSTRSTLARPAFVSGVRVTLGSVRTIGNISAVFRGRHSSACPQGAYRGICTRDTDSFQRGRGTRGVPHCRGASECLPNDSCPRHERTFQSFIEAEPVPVSLPAKPQSGWPTSCAPRRKAGSDPRRSWPKVCRAPRLS